MEFKYIILDKTKAMLFNHSIEHAHAAAGPLATHEHKRVTSAGFCQLRVINGQGYVKCFGESDSLGIGSDNHERDAMLILKIAQGMMGVGVE